MALTVTHILTVLSLLQYTLSVGDRVDAPTQDLLRQHEEEQSQEMTWLLEEMEQRSQDLRGLPQESVLLAACQHWWFWASAESLLLFFGLYWLPRQKSADSDSGSQHGNSISEEEEEEEEAKDGSENKLDSYDAQGIISSLWIRVPRLLKHAGSAWFGDGIGRAQLKADEMKIMQAVQEQAGHGEFIPILLLSER